jgi:glutathione peroxidase-family protein
MTRRELFPMALAPLAAGLVPAFGQTLPRPADSLAINTLTGTKMDVKSMKGKVVAVELLLTWCSHCQASGRVLQDLYTELKPKGFEVVGAATNWQNMPPPAEEAKKAVGEFMGITKAAFPIGWIMQDDAMRFLQHPAGKNLYFPQLVLIDRAGRVVFQHTGEVDASELRAEITKALAAPATRVSTAKKKA